MVSPVGQGPANSAAAPEEAAAQAEQPNLGALNEHVVLQIFAGALSCLVSVGQRIQALVPQLIRVATSAATTVKEASDLAASVTKGWLDGAKKNFISAEQLKTWLAAATAFAQVFGSASQAEQSA